MKPVDSTYWHASIGAFGAVRVASVTLRDTGAQTLAVVDGDRFLTRYQRRVTRSEVEAFHPRGRLGGLALSRSPREAIEAAAERSEYRIHELREALERAEAERDAFAAVTVCDRCASDDVVVRDDGTYCDDCIQELMRESLEAVGGARLIAAEVELNRAEREWLDAR